MKKYTYLSDYIKKIGISIDELKKMQKIVDDTYYNLCQLGLYGDIYYKLQNIHGYLDDLLSDEYLEEDALDDVLFFYTNNYKN